LSHRIDFSVDQSRQETVIALEVARMPTPCGHDHYRLLDRCGLLNPSRSEIAICTNCLGLRLAEPHARITLFWDGEIKVQAQPVFEGWSDFATGSIADLPRYFGEGTNIGIRYGALSGHLTDIDLDCREALELAALYLPDTGAKYGRANRPASHWLYLDKGARKEQFSFAREVLLEIRTDGREGHAHQSIVPPSIADGERRRWASRGWLGQQAASDHPTSQWGKTMTMTTPKFEIEMITEANAKSCIRCHAPGDINAVRFTYDGAGFGYEVPAEDRNFDLCGVSFNEHVRWVQKASIEGQLDRGTELG
jgi:hypothetical protein